MAKAEERAKAFRNLSFHNGNSRMYVYIGA